MIPPDNSPETHHETRRPPFIHESAGRGAAIGDVLSATSDAREAEARHRLDDEWPQSEFGDVRPLWLRGDDGRPRLARLLLSAYACSPRRGSEHAVGWRRALCAAQISDTTLLCDDHARREVDAYAAENPLPPRLKFVWMSRRSWEPRLFSLPGGFYWYYRRWQRRAFDEARRLHAEQPFDLVHQVNYCGFREPGFLWRLDAPFLWGPIGGTQNFPSRFYSQVDRIGAAREATRAALNGLQLRFGRRIHRAAGRAAVVLAANSTNLRDLRRTLRVEPRLQLETGLDERTIRQRDARRSGDPLRILWVGNLSTWKAPQILFRALERLASSGGVSFELTMIGGGPLESGLRRMAERGRIADRVRWCGKLTYAETLRQYVEADVLAFTSLRDTSGNVMLEAMSAGVPIVCFDLQGARDMVTDDCGLKISIDDASRAAERWAESLARLADDNELWTRLSQGAVRRAEYYGWRNQAARMADVYREVLAERLVDPSAPRDLAAEEEPAS